MRTSQHINYKFTFFVVYVSQIMYYFHRKSYEKEKNRPYPIRRLTLYRV